MNKSSIDWSLSPIFDEIHFAKEKKTIGGRKLMTTMSSAAPRNENCGSQVDENQIILETSTSLLSQIECEYNVDQLKRRVQQGDSAL